MENYEVFKKVADMFDFDYKILLTHAAHETNWGTKVKGNNYFGIKAGKYWKGDTIDFVTHEYINGEKIRIVDKFRAYKSIEDSIIDYCKLIKNSKRYKEAYEARKNPDKYFYYLYKAGYATNPNYVTYLKLTYEIVVDRLKKLGLEV
ncbi:MAG: glucosaminidase domain-containing protein [Nitrososphaerota archaeon]